MLIGRDIQVSYSNLATLWQYGWCMVHHHNTVGKGRRQAARRGRGAAAG